MGFVKPKTYSERDVFLRNASKPRPPHHQEPVERNNGQGHSDFMLRLRKTNHRQLWPEGVSDHVAAKALTWQRFTTLAIQIDPPAADNPARAFIAALEKCLSENAAPRQAIWFRWSGPLYAFLMPDTNTDQALEFSKTLHLTLSEQFPETVTIGIAGFPQLAFNHAQTLINACKAIDHAAFFGSGSSAVFDAVSLNISGDKFYQTGDLIAAVTEYRAALQIDPENINVHNSLGVCMAVANNLPAAYKAFRAVLRLDPKETMALYNLGMILLLKKDDEKALTLFERAHALAPQTFEVAFQIGKLLTRKKMWKKAGVYLEQAARLRDTQGAVFSLIGRCLVGMGKMAEAAEAYKKAIKRNPNDAAALSALGALYDAKGENPDICLTFCRQSVHLAPGNGLYRKRLARLFHKYNRLEEALEAYEKAAELGQECSRQIEKLKEQIPDATEKRKCCA